MFCQSSSEGRNAELKFGECFTADKSISLAVAAKALPANVVHFLDSNRARIDLMTSNSEFTGDRSFWLVFLTLFFLKRMMFFGLDLSENSEQQARNG